MTYSKIVLSVFFAAGIVGQAVAAPLPFAPGEVIQYNVKQFGVKVGNATLEFKGDTYSEGKKYTLVVFTAKGGTFYDEERIFLDPDTLLPAKVMRDLDIFGNKEVIMEEYDQAGGRLVITKTAGGKTTSQTISTSGPAENLYGFLYRTRRDGAVSVGQSVEMRLPTLTVRFAGIEAMKFRAAGQQYSAVMIRSVPPKYTIWFDVGEHRLPLRISGSLGLANTVMTMTGYEQLKEVTP